MSILHLASKLSVKILKYYWTSLWVSGYYLPLSADEYGTEIRKNGYFYIETTIDNQRVTEEEISYLIPYLHRELNQKWLGSFLCTREKHSNAKHFEQDRVVSEESCDDMKRLRHYESALFFAFLLPARCQNSIFSALQGRYNAQKYAPLTCFYTIHWWDGTERAICTPRIPQGLEVRRVSCVSGLSRFHMHVLLCW